MGFPIGNLKKIIGWLSISAYVPHVLELENFSSELPAGCVLTKIKTQVSLHYWANFTGTHYRIEGSMLNLLCFIMPSTITQLLKSQFTIWKCNHPLEIFIINDLFHIWLQLLLIKIVIFQAQSRYGTIYL